MPVARLRQRGGPARRRPRPAGPRRRSLAVQQQLHDPALRPGQPARPGGPVSPVLRPAADPASRETLGVTCATRNRLVPFVTSGRRPGFGGEMIRAAASTSAVHRVVTLAVTGALAAGLWRWLRRATGTIGGQMTGTIWSGEGRMETAPTLFSAGLTMTVIAMGASIGRESPPKEAAAALAERLARCAACRTRSACCSWHARRMAPGPPSPPRGAARSAVVDGVDGDAGRRLRPRRRHGARHGGDVGARHRGAPHDRTDPPPHAAAGAGRSLAPDTLPSPGGPSPAAQPS